MPRALWSGSISFGLVNVPVKLFPAVYQKEVHFHQLDAKTGCRLHQKLFCPDHEDEEVPRDRVVKGYEVAPDQYVVVDKKELDALAPEETRDIAITDFVDLSSIDPVFYQRPYYLLPDERAGHAYQLLVEAMERSQKVGIAKFVMHNKEYLAAIRPIRCVLCVETMNFADEVVQPEQFERPKAARPNEKELAVAEQLVKALAGKFEPEKYKDEYRLKLQELIEKKAKGERISTAEEQSQPTGRVLNLMAALQQSLNQAAKKKPPQAQLQPHRQAAGGGEHRRRRKSA